MTTALAEEPTLILLALWADTVQVHVLLFDVSVMQPLLASTDIVAGGYPALSPMRPLAAWFERMVQDLWGHAALGGTDLRPWLDHGRWPHTHPMALRPGPAHSSHEPPEFLPVDQEGFHQLPLGPIRGEIEPASHLRLTGQGETVARLEVRLGYAHKGTLTLMRGKSPRAAARFAARLSAEATVAHTVAFTQATEAALAANVPDRALALRMVMAELERIASHLGDLNRISEAAGFLIATACSEHLEALRRVAEQAFGHRLMMDCVVPGGVTADIAPGGAKAIRRAIAKLETALPELAQLNSNALRDVGVVRPDLVERFAVGGPVARAAGRDTDLRHTLTYPPYDTRTVTPITRTQGDVAARASIRLAEIVESLRLLRATLADLPEGPVSVPLPSESGEGLGFAEGPRGDVWYWLRLDHGLIASVFARDPAWTHWVLLEALAAGISTEDLPLIEVSFGLTSSGADL